MQQIERYGVIVLVFLLVTIVAISFWGDSKSPGFWSRLTGKRAEPPKALIAQATPPVALPTVIADPGLPLSPAPQPLAPAPVQGLGQPQPLGAIDQPALGNGTLQPPSGAVVAGPTAPVAIPFAPQPAVASLTAQAPAPAPATNEYVVQKGDSLARIARAKLGSEMRWTEIALLNPGLNPKNLTVGAKVKLPQGAAPAAQPASKTAQTKAVVARHDAKPQPKSEPKPTLASAHKAAPAAGRTCLVQKGDTLRSIARRELGDEARWKEIATLNPGHEAGKLAIGAKLKLPASHGSALLAAASPAAATSGKPRVR